MDTSTSQDHGAHSADHPMLPQYHYILYGTMFSLEFVLGTGLNVLVLVYFLTKREASNSRFLYLCINSVDITICGLSFLSAVTAFKGGSAALLQHPIVCTCHGMLWNIAPRLSIFLIAVLSISRTLSLIYPLRKMRKIQIAAPVVVYTLLQALQSTIPFWFGKRYKFSDIHLICGWALNDIEMNQIVASFLYLLFTTVQFVLPAVPIVLSCCLSCYQLRNSNSTIKNSETKCRKRQATITILFLTAAYIFFNLPVWVYTITKNVIVFRGDWEMELSYEQDVLLQNLLTTHTVIVNSIVNAVVYLVRLTGLRSFVCRIMRGMCVWGRCGKSDNVKRLTHQLTHQVTMG
ncbi:hypothetical protein ACHWQZ_G009165 [Mnemiopsis leidyi]